jgi:hypothetical protein
MICRKERTRRERKGLREALKHRCELALEPAMPTASAMQTRERYKLAAGGQRGKKSQPTEPNSILEQQLWPKCLFVPPPQFSLHPVTAVPSSTQRSSSRDACNSSRRLCCAFGSLTDPRLAARNMVERFPTAASTSSTFCW